MATTLGSVFAAPLRGLRWLYEWVVHWADTPYGVPALAVVAFAEASFFPVPPDALLIALGLGKPKKAYHYALVCSIFSLLGAVAGYLIGFGAWEATRSLFIPHLFSQEAFDKVGQLYHQNAFLAIFTAALSPLPYKVFTIAAGVWHDHVSLLTLLVASALGRPLRFFGVATIMYFFGPPAKRFIDRYFNWLAVAFVALLVGGFVVLKRLT